MFTGWLPKPENRCGFRYRILSGLRKILQVLLFQSTFQSNPGKSNEKREIDQKIQFSIYLRCNNV